MRTTVDADRLKAELGDQFTPLQFDLRDAEAIRTAAGLARSLHLTHTSPAPIPGLLAGMEEVLCNACAV